MKKAIIVALALSLFAAIAGAEEQPVTIEGSPCSDEATLNDMQAAKPFICTDGKWRKVVFKTDAEGVTSPLFYEGKCSWRFTEGSITKVRLKVKGRSLTDICIPTGWRMHVVASDNSMSWKYHSPPSMPNVLLTQAIDPGNLATLWIYPVTSDGKAPQKLEVQLRSVK